MSAMGGPRARHGREGASHDGARRRGRWLPFSHLARAFEAWGTYGHRVEYRWLRLPCRRYAVVVVREPARRKGS